TFLIITSPYNISVMATIIAEHITDNTEYKDCKIQSAVLGETRKLIVKLPNGYGQEEDVQYPVVYVIGSSGLMSQISNDVDLLNRTGYLEKMILVCVTTENAKGRRRDLTPPFLFQELDKKNSPKGEADQFLEYIEKEAIPFVNTKFATNSDKLILGHSREGLFTMYSMIARPDLFTGHIALSPALWRENELFIDKMGGFLNSRDSSGGFLYMSIGDAEVAKMKNAFDKMGNLLSTSSNSPEWISQYIEGATHQTNHYLSATIGIVNYFDRKKLR
ncbi:MAG: alpha/beta hydrolase, partial [Ekhidna sp.]